MAEAIRDGNHVTNLLLESSSTPGLTLNAKGDQVTGRLLVDSAGGGTGTVTSIAAGTGILLTPDPITTTGTVALTAVIQPIATLGTALQSIRVNAGATALEYYTPGGGSGDVVGPGSATDNAIARFDTTTGKLIQNSAVTIADTTGVISGTQGVVLSGTTSGTLTVKSAAVAGTNTITLPAGTTDFSATGGTSQVVKQTSAGGAFTVAQLAASDLSDGANLVTAAATFATDESILRADGTGRGAQGTSTNATLTDAGVLTLAGLATATGFSPTDTTATGNRMYLPAANTLGFAINGTGEVQISASAMSPITSDGNALGTSSLQWSDLFLASGALIDFANGNVVLTHSSAILTVSTGDLRVTTAGTNTASVVTVGGTQTLTAKTLTNPTINAAVITGDFQVDGTPNTDDTWNGPSTNTFNAGATIAQWEVVYLSSSSTWLLADADAVTTAGSVPIALAAEAGTNTNPLRVLLPGSFARNDAWNWTPGAPLYIDTAAGALTATAPSGTDDVIRVVAHAYTADVIFWNPSNDWITHT